MTQSPAYCRNCSACPHPAEPEIQRSCTVCGLPPAAPPSVHISRTADAQQVTQMEQLPIHILVRHLVLNSHASIQTPAALKLSDGVPAEVAPYLKVRMKLPRPISIHGAGREYDRQVDRKAAAFCMKFTV
jgi:hypothetical protein